MNTRNQNQKSVANDDLFGLFMKDENVVLIPYKKGILILPPAGKGKSFMKRITINNYQYWYNTKTGILYVDKDGLVEVAKQSFTAQEMTQFYNAIR